MGNTVAFDYLARDKASGPTKAVGRAMDETAGKASGLVRAFGAITAGSRGLHTSFGLIGRGAALAAGAAGIAGLVDGFKAVYSEGREAQKSGAQTAAVIKSTGGVAHVSAAQVGALATSISNKVGVDDEAIQSGANLLLTFTNVRNEAGKGNKVFDQATSTVTDMAAALNNGAVTTDGLKSASIQVGKALSDPIKGITALTRVGVTFDAGQKKQIATMVKHHDILGAQKIILGELNKEFGGSAAAGATAGQKLGVVFKNIEEAVGTALLPTFDKVATWLSRALPAAVAVGQRVLGDFSGAVSAGLNGTVPTTGGVFTYVAKATAVIKGLAAWISGTGVPAIEKTFTQIKLDLSPVAAAFTASAKTWGGALIGGVRTGLATGDWSGLGQTVGRGLVAAIQGAGGFAKDIGGKISDLLAKVDWVGIGIAVGKQAPSLLVGLAAGILNFDLMGLLRGLAAHWQDVLFAVIAVAFTPARILGKVGEVLARIPLVGKLLAWGLEHFAAFSKRLVGMVFDSLGFMGRAFLAGFRRVFPGVGSAFGRELSILPTRLGVVAIIVRDRAALMMKRLADAIVGGIGRVVANIGELIGRMVRPFTNAGGWLIRRGTEFVGGLVRGVGGGLGSAAGAAGRVIRTVTSPFTRAGSWLVSAGGDLIGGLFSGMRSMMGIVGRILSDVKNAIVGGLKKLFGINSPSTVMAGIGGHLITGLIKGLLTKSGALARTVKDIGGSVTGIFGDTLVAAGSSGLLGGLFHGGGNVSGNAKLGQQMAAAYGWSGGEWSALYQLWQGESGWNNNAQNPTSTAYGIPQFLNSTWAGVGASKTSDPASQIAAGMKYIRQVYGDPIHALGMWQSRAPHWYGAGMSPTVFDRPTLIGVGERGPETVTVVPHSRAGPAAGVRDIHVHISGAVGADRQTVTAWVRQGLREALRAEGKPVTV